MIVGVSVYASPYGLVPVRAENFSYSPINVGTAHIPHGTLYIWLRRAAFVMHAIL